MRAALFLVSAIALMSVTALAADGGGIYNVQVVEGYKDTVTVTPQTTEGTATASSVTVDNTTYNDFYEGAVKVGVAYSNVNTGNYYLVLALNEETAIPTADNIVYIDQDTGKAEFTVYPSSLESGKTYGIYLSSNDSTLTSLTKVASFQYYMPYTLGDVDEDGAIRVTDAVKVLEKVVEKTTFTSNQMLAADVNKDGAVRVNDAALILDYVVEKITSFD
nr:dockerin type I repeat-containing protein [uncultured Oscillibacter sp.]